jgi:hypothetical protein
MFCIASIGAAVQSKPPGTFTKPQGLGGSGSRSSILMVMRFSEPEVRLCEIFGGEILAGSEIYWARGDGNDDPGEDGETCWSGGAKSELSKEQEILRTLQR